MLYSVPYWFGIAYNLVDTDLYAAGSVDTLYMR